MPGPNPSLPAASAGIASEFPVTQFDEATTGNLMMSAGNGYVQDSGVNFQNPVHQTLTLTSLSTADPHQPGALWNNGGVINISAG